MTLAVPTEKIIRVNWYFKVRRKRAGKRTPWPFFPMILYPTSARALLGKLKHTKTLKMTFISVNLLEQNHKADNDLERLMVKFSHKDDVVMLRSCHIWSCPICAAHSDAVPFLLAVGMSTVLCSCSFKLHLSCLCFTGFEFITRLWFVFSS